jgi:hypothetical protein
MTILMALPSLARSSKFTLRASYDSLWVFWAWFSATASCSRAIRHCSSSALVSEENKQSDELWQTHKKDEDGIKALGLLSSCSNKHSIELSFLMTLSKVVFNTCFCFASFEVIPVRYTRIPEAPGNKSERTRGKPKAKW